MNKKNLYKSDVLNYLNERGFIYQATDIENLDELLFSKKIAIYAGFDLTANSLHVGSLLPIMIMRIFQQFGYKPIILLGSATTKIGDPSGKDKTRQILTPEIIEQNKQGISKVFQKFIDFEGEAGAEIVDNDEWLDGYNYLDFLREVGKHFSINQMLRYESVKQRLDREQNLSFIEFNYMILQGYDFTKLKEKYNCYLQIGGSDQWGNIINGVELNRKINQDSDEIYGLTTPLLVDSNGKKMGKTESGAVWLDEALLSAYDYFQFFRNITDDKAIEFLNFFTELPLDKIDELANLEGQKINEAKEILAFEATKLCHGADAAQNALETARNLFEAGKAGGDLPVVEISKSELENGIEFSALIAKSEIVASRGEAKRIILGGGGKINDISNKDPRYSVNLADFSDAEEIKISAGKKKHAIIRVV